MLVEPYLSFEGRCEEALAFYTKAVGAKVGRVMRFKDNPEPMPGSEALAEKILHCTFKIGDSTLMASDGQCGGGGPAAFSGVTLTVSVADEAAAQTAFAGLTADGGQVHMPLGKTFFSPAFGILADRFGVKWMVLATPAG